MWLPTTSVLFTVLLLIDYNKADVNERWLTELRYPTRLGSNVDINLSQINKEEKCSIITPDGRIVAADDNDLTGVTVKSSSKFVSCRIVVGPTDASLLGRWTVCGEYTEQGTTHKRCQPLVIAWNNANNPSATWTVRSRPYFDHAVSFGGTLGPIVTVSTNVATCHIITPEGEDLPITWESTYPGLTRGSIFLARVCNVNIGPITDYHLGNWTLYGRFGTVNQISREIWFPMTLSLYDEENPYSQPYNVTLENPTSHTVDLNNIINVNIAAPNNRLSFESCEVISALGYRYTNTGNEGTEPVTISVQTISSRATCQSNIGPISETMIGEWQIIGKFNNASNSEERRRLIRIVRRPTETVTRLTQINHVILRGSYADVALNRISDEEKCSIITPLGEELPFEDSNIRGVTVRDSSSFVSCRITVGPVDDGLRGEWSVCGVSGENNNLRKRCQPANIAWSDVDNSTTSWEVRLQNHFDHPVNYGGSLRPVVVGSAVPISCHIITPNGEDLLITTSSDYPGLTLTSSGSSRLCNVTIGPINADFIGDWTLYGKYGSAARITREIRFPMTLFVYDEDNPYNQAYNISTQNPVTHFARVGGVIVGGTVNGTGAVDICEVISPSGQMYTSDGILGNEPVVFGNLGSRIACEVTVGPITSGMFGEWQLIGKFTNRTHFQEVRGPFRIIEDSATTERLPRIQRPTRTGEFVDISLNKVTAEEECSYITPDGDIVLAKDNDELGIQVHSGSSYVACRITVGPMDGSLIGLWSVCGEHKTEADTYRRCQSVDILWSNTNNPSTAWQVVEQNHFNHVVNFNGVLTPVIVGPNNILSCHIITPNNEDLIITNTTQYPGLTRAVPNIVRQCSVAIGPIDVTHLGNWTLYGLFGTNNQVAREIRFPMNLFLYDENNPYNKAYNVTVRDRQSFVINLGTTIFMNITGSGSVDDCEVVSPSDQMYTQTGISGTEKVNFINMGSGAVCNVLIGPITEDMVGNWLFSGKFNNRNIFTEIQIPFTIIREDPSNPIIDDSRDITYLNEQNYNTVIGANQNVIINTISNNNVQSCHIRTPDGLQYMLMDGFNVTGVTVLRGSNIACGINVYVLSKEQYGDWMVISREMPRSSNRGIERRLPFSIQVEDFVNAFPKNVVIRQGNDLHVRLEHPTSQYATCKLYGPNGNVNEAELDQRFVDMCGFKVQAMNTTDSGEWEIRYGRGIIYRAAINVVVNAVWTPEQMSLQFFKDRPIEKTIGPEDAVYCRIRDPSGRIVFDSFGQCNIVLDKVTREHAGTWKVSVGMPGSLLVDEYDFVVELMEPETKSVVTTTVEKENPQVMLTCSLPSHYQVNACKFQDPSGRVILANEGVGEDRFIFHGSGISGSSDPDSNECGLRIIDPQTEDLGIWRCTVETDEDVFYGFLTVLCPWAMSVPEIAEVVVSEPVLGPTDLDTIEALESHAATMSCSIQSAIRYCYFRASNGTIFNVSPGVTLGNFEYAGAGLDAGECGIRFTQLAASDTGRWTCHVGFPDLSEREQFSHFNVTIQEPLVVKQYMDNDVLVVEGSVYNSRQLEYCRFVRIDGLGFTSATLPDNRYRSHDDLEHGRCSIHIDDATILEHHPWTLVVRINGQDMETSRVTVDTITRPPPDPETPDTPPPPTEAPTNPPSITTEPSPSPTELPTESPTESTTTPATPTTTTPYPHPYPTPEPPVYSQNSIVVWIAPILAGILLILLGLLIIPKRNREKALARMVMLRTSIRRSLQKKPLVDVTTVDVVEDNIAIPTQTQKPV